MIGIPWGNLLSAASGGIGIKLVEFLWSRKARGDQQVDALLDRGDKKQVEFQKFLSAELEASRQAYTKLSERVAILEAQVQEQRDLKHEWQNTAMTKQLRITELETENKKLRDQLARRKR